MLPKTYNELLEYVSTVAILAQGTPRALAAKQAFCLLSMESEAEQKKEKMRGHALHVVRRRKGARGSDPLAAQLLSSARVAPCAGREKLTAP